MSSRGYRRASVPDEMDMDDTSKRLEKDVRSMSTSVCVSASMTTVALFIAIAALVIGIVLLLRREDTTASGLIAEFARTVTVKDINANYALLDVDSLLKTATVFPFLDPSLNRTEWARQMGVFMNLIATNYLVINDCNSTVSPIQCVGIYSYKYLASPLETAPTISATFPVLFRINALAERIQYVEILAGGVISFENARAGSMTVVNAAASSTSKRAIGIFVDAAKTTAVSPRTLPLTEIWDVLQQQIATLVSNGNSEQAKATCNSTYYLNLELIFDPTRSNTSLPCTSLMATGVGGTELTQPLTCTGAGLVDSSCFDISQQTCALGSLAENCIPLRVKTINGVAPNGGTSDFTISVSNGLTVASTASGINLESTFRGPTPAVSDSIAVWNGTSGTTLKDSVISINGSTLSSTGTATLTLSSATSNVSFSNNDLKSIRIASAAIMETSSIRTSASGGGTIDFNGAALTNYVLHTSGSVSSLLSSGFTGPGLKLEWFKMGVFVNLRLSGVVTCTGASSCSPFFVAGVLPIEYRPLVSYEVTAQDGTPGSVSSVLVHVGILTDGSVQVSKVDAPWLQNEDIKFSGYAVSLTHVTIVAI